MWRVWQAAISGVGPWLHSVVAAGTSLASARGGTASVARPAWARLGLDSAALCEGVSSFVLALSLDCLGVTLPYRFPELSMLLSRRSLDGSYSPAPSMYWPTSGGIGIGGSVGYLVGKTPLEGPSAGLSSEGTYTA